MVDPIWLVCNTYISLTHSLTRIHSDSPNIIWCRLDKQLLGLQEDIFLAAVYLPQLQSQRKAGEDVIRTLEKEIHNSLPKAKFFYLVT